MKKKDEKMQPGRSHKKNSGRETGADKRIKNRWGDDGRLQGLGTDIRERERREKMGAKRKRERASER